MYVVTSEKLPIKIWATDLEDGALDQAKNLANLPFAFKHIAILPDSHQGYGMPIGGVLAAKDAVVPNCVGVDVGCGLRAVRTNLQYIAVDDLKEVLGMIRQLVPVGFSHHTEKQDKRLFPETNGVRFTVVEREYNKALYQLGTLGGGNHFIEIQRGSDGYIWAMIHSGSRNLGKQVADHYNKLAVELNKQWFSSVPEKHELAFLPQGTVEYGQYLDEMNLCVSFAEANRSFMMEQVKRALCDIVHADFTWEYDIPHNYAAMENHSGENVMVHRKGATRAYAGEYGIIPGSQGSKSYIVKGLGNEQSFKSCSHGAGRKMGRKQAQRELSVEEEVRKLDEMGVLHSIRGQKDLDEAPSAYKDIDVVMANQKDLVEIEVELTPMAVVKG